MASNDFEFTTTQSAADEFGIEFSKVDQLKQYETFIYDVFRVSLQFDSSVKALKTTPTKHMTQWVALYGEDKNRSETKEFIKALCNPEWSRILSKTNDELDYLNKDDFLNGLIKEHRVFIGVDRIKQTIALQGSVLNTTIVESLIENKLINFIKPKQPSPQSATTSSLSQHSKNTPLVASSDSIIYLSDDPYEELDMPKPRTQPSTPAKNQPNTVQRISDDINKSLEKLNVSPAPLNPSMSSSFSQNSLIRVGLAKGYTFDEINSAIVHFGTPKIGETEYLNYLKSNRESYLLKVSNAHFLQSDTQAPLMSIVSSPTPTKLTQVINEPHANTHSPTKSPVSKRLHLSDPTNDCEIIDFIPNSPRKAAISTTATATSSKPLVTSSNIKALEEYALMIQTQEFDKKREIANKEARLSKLMSAMPDEQQARALYQVKTTIKAKTDTTSATTTTTTSSLMDEGISTNLVWNTNTVNSERPKSPRTILKNDPNYINSNQPPYNPRLYTTFEDRPITPAKTKASNKIQFTNFDEDDFGQDDVRGSGKNQDTRIPYKSNEAKSFNKMPFKSNSFKDSSTLDTNNNTKNPMGNTAKSQNHPGNNNNNNNNGENKQKKRSKSIADRDEQPSTASAIQTIPRRNNLRPIFIDGSNVAREHGMRRNVFSCRGIQIVVEYFQKRGHDKVEVYLPRFRRGTSDDKCPSIDAELLDKLYEIGVLKYTPSKSYDDRFILIAASHHDGVIVSNDQYRDLQEDNKEWKTSIPKRLLQFVFSDDLFIPAEDPLGRYGPKLDKFLSFSNTTDNVGSKQNTNGQRQHQGSNGASRSRPDKNPRTSHTDSNQNQNSNRSQLNNQRPHSSSASALQSNFDQARLNVNENSRQKVTPSNPVKNFRNVAQTTDLYNSLIAIFPESHDLIRDLLNKNPSNYDVQFFSDKLMDSLNW